MTKLWEAWGVYPPTFLRVRETRGCSSLPFAAAGASVGVAPCCCLLQQQPFLLLQHHHQLLLLMLAVFSAGY